jgi:hypothetical protein
MNRDFPPKLVGRLWNAVEVLALRRGSVSERLSHAYHDHAAYIASKDLPKELRSPFEQFCADFSSELAKTQNRLKEFKVFLRSVEAGKYMHHAAARRLAKKLIQLCREPASELEVWARNSSCPPPDLKRLDEARRRRQKALRRTPIEAQLLSGTSYLIAAGGESTKGVKIKKPRR